MTIAVLGWGSLIWNPGSLPLGSGWFEDGPKMPIEFARTSKDGRLTLVVHGNKEVNSLWAKLDCKDKSEAIEALRKREGTLEKHIGWRFEGDQSVSEFKAQHSINVADWMKEKSLVGVVWTALPPKWNSKNGDAPSEVDAIGYLNRLTGASRDLAFEYIRKAPAQIETRYRKNLQKKFPELSQ